MLHATNSNNQRDTFCLARCDDLICLKARYPDNWFSGSSAWGLKQMGHLFVVDRLMTIRPQRVLEIGAGKNPYFDRWCHEQNIEYWMCDAASFYPADEFNQAMEKRKHTHFVNGFLGENLEELPSEYFDVIFSISVIEHIPQKKLENFYIEMRRVLHPEGRILHSIDLPIGSPASEIHRNVLSETGFGNCNLSQPLEWAPDVLLEPLEIQYIYYGGSGKDIWGKDIKSINAQYSTVLLDLCINSADDKILGANI